MEPKFASNAPGRAGIRRRLVACLLVTRPLDRSRRARGFPLDHQRLGGSYVLPSNRVPLYRAAKHTASQSQSRQAAIDALCAIYLSRRSATPHSTRNSRRQSPNTGGLTKSANCCPRCCPGAFLRSFLQRKPDNLLILFGSPGRIRTSDQPVNSRLLYR